MLFTRQTALDIVKFIHLLIIIISIFGPWFIKNKYYLLTILFFYIVLIVQWSVFDFCILSQIEDAIENKYSHLNETKSSNGFMYTKINTTLFPLTTNDLKDIQCIFLLLNGLYINYKLMKII